VLDHLGVAGGPGGEVSQQYVLVLGCPISGGPDEVC